MSEVGWAGDGAADLARAEAGDVRSQMCQRRCCGLGVAEAFDRTDALSIIEP
jgi:hypothetical protein